MRCFLLAIVSTLLWCHSLVWSKERPNVVVIYSDDQGTLDANCYGSHDLVTPHLDALAAEGVRFTQMYAPSAICSSSRAGLMTGKYPFRAGVPSNVSPTKRGAGMPTSEVTMAELLRGAGYRTGHVGKWHLGHDADTTPNGQGFEESFGHMGGCIDNYSHFFYWNGPNRHDLWRNGTEVWHDGRYFGDLMVEECQRLITQWKDEPFFIYWAINWPHYPMQGSAKWREVYRDLPHPRDKYAVFVSTMDEMVGRVVDHLKELGLRENTIIIFQSDHGHSVEERAFFGGGNPGPYRGAKGCLFEAGIRVPSIVSWPAELPKGEVRGQMAVGCDWWPTVAEWTGAPIPAGHRIDGKSLDRVVRSSQSPTPHDILYWHLGRGEKPQWVVRRGDWKLLGNPQDRRAPESLQGVEFFLANLRDDPSETTNLAVAHADLVQELLGIRDDIVSATTQ